MPQAKSISVLSVLLAWLLWAVLPVTAWAYVNGGDYRNDLGKYEESLRAKGWRVGCSPPILGNDARVKGAFKGIKVDPADKPAFGRFVKELVARATQALPENEAAQVSAEDRDKIVEIAAAAIEDAVSRHKASQQTARVGALEFQAGGFEFYTWWETKYGGKLEIHAKRPAGVVPFVALKVADDKDQKEPKKLVIVAGKPSHPPRMHEFNAGVQLLARCLKDFPGLKTQFVLNGWPKDEKIFDDADAVVFYMDGGGGHEVVQERGRRLEIVDGWAKKGVGLGFMHYGVEIVPDQAGPQFHRWIGGYYEHMFSCNPMWEPRFESFPEHPITRGVKPFQIKDEWYFNMRFAAGVEGNKPQSQDGLKFVPILVAAPSEKVRNGPYVYPPGPYPHIQAAKGRAESMLWAVERAEGGRGFGFTGGHFHDNWGNDEFRKVVLNALVWLAKAEVPAEGVKSQVAPKELDENLDLKPAPKK